MDNNFFWNVFTNTGSIESYLAYKSSESVKTNDTQTQNENVNVK